MKQPSDWEMKSFCYSSKFLFIELSQSVRYHVTLNPNIAVEMAQMLKDYQSNYVPGFVSENKKEVVVNVPVPGDRYSKRD